MSMRWYQYPVALKIPFCFVPFLCFRENNLQDSSGFPLAVGIYMIVRTFEWKYFLCRDCLQNLMVS